MKISNGTLAALLTNLLTNPHSGELDSMDKFEEFLNDLARVVCNHCGGEITTESRYVDMTSDDEFGSAYVLEVEPNESSPAEDDIWSRSAAVQVLSGHFNYEGTVLRADFQAPIGATTAQKDAAFMAMLAQQADINYLAVGEVAPPLLGGDYGLTAEQLEDKHGQEHPVYSRGDWSRDVSQNDTRLGYWDWVLHNVESHYHDPCEFCGDSGCDKLFIAGVGYVCKDCAEDSGRLLAS